MAASSDDSIEGATRAQATPDYAFLAGTDDPAVAFPPPNRPVALLPLPPSPVTPSPAALRRAIERCIVPRLVLARSRAAKAHAVQSDPAATARLCAILLAGEERGALMHVAELRAQGASLESVLLDRLTQAARELGRRWCEDEADFAEVTIGMAGLSRLLHALEPEFIAQTRPAVAHGVPRKILLTPLFGEQHGFGHFMVAAFFRRAGWQVAAEPIDSIAVLRESLRSTWQAVLGFSLSCADRLPELAGAIRAARRASCNPALAVLVGGQAFHGRPDRVALVGADGTAADAREATLRAEALLRLAPALETAVA
jgi:methanogenic corrinoid protein MtbC1